MLAFERADKKSYFLSAWRPSLYFFHTVSIFYWKYIVLHPMGDRFWAISLINSWN